MASADLRLVLVLCVVGVSSSKLMKDADDGKLRCEAEGRYAHPDKCDEYVDCIPGREGNGLEAHAASCKGGVFNSDVMKCLEPGKDNNCTTHDRQARAITLYPNYDSLCDELQSGFFCLTCKTLVNCVNGRANVDECMAGHTCDMRETFGGGVCYPNSPPECSCNNQKELRSDLYSEKAYLECEAGDSEPIVQMCHDDMIFKEEILMCDYPVGYVECTKRGIFPNPEDCTEYHKCMPVARGLIQYTLSCPCGLLFNDLTERCEDPCSYQPVEFACQAEGRFPDQYDCHKFYLCITDASSETGFRKYHSSCPQRSMWRPGRVSGTGSCQLTIGTSECANRRQPKCAVPAGRNCTLAPTVTAGGSCNLGSPMCQCNSATGELSCQEGYTGDGRACIVSDSCGGVICDPNAECDNNNCVCLPGFSGDGEICVPEEDDSTSPPF